MSSSNQTQRVLLSEQFVDDLYYTASATITRTEVVFNNETVVFIKLANDGAPTTLSLPMCEIDTFLTAYGDYQHKQKVEPALQDSQAFRAWLVTRRESHQSIGGSSTSFDNPLSLWLTDLYGKPYSAGSRGYGPEGTDAETQTTWWMQAFMDKVRADSDTPNLDPRIETPELDPTYAIAVVDALTEPLEDLDEHPF